MRPGIDSLKARVINDLGPDGVSVYTGPLDKPHVQLTVPKTPPKKGSVIARFYSHAQYNAFLAVQKEKENDRAAAA